jgi:hypothetical protein
LDEAVAGESIARRTTAIENIAADGCVRAGDLARPDRAGGRSNLHHLAKSAAQIPLPRAGADGTLDLMDVHPPRPPVSHAQKGFCGGLRAAGSDSSPGASRCSEPRAWIS